MTEPMKTLAMAAAGAAALGLVVAATPASACDVTSSTDISCGGANSNPGNPYNIANQPHPENTSSQPFSATGYGEAPDTGATPGAYALCEAFGLCAPRPAAIHHHRHPHGPVP